MAFDPVTHLTLKYGDRSAVVFREHCLRHENLLAVAQRAFPSLQNASANDVVLTAAIPGRTNTESVELSPEIWNTFCDVVRTVAIAMKSEMQSTSSTMAFDSLSLPDMLPPDTLIPSGLSPHLPPHPSPQLSLQDHVSIGPSPIRPDSPVPSQTEQSSNVLQAIVISFPARLRPTPASFEVSEPGLLGKTVSRLYELIDPQAGYSASNSSLMFGNSYLNNERTFSDYGIISGDSILLNPNPIRARRARRVLRKPVIYLFPPLSLPDVTVKLTLTSTWRFSVVHPPPRATVPPGEPHTAQSLTWAVAAEPSGMLIDKTSGMEVSYLYWEAIANSQLVTPVPSRPTTPIANTETFDPAHTSVDPGDSVLLPTSKVPGYLDASLKALALHTEARTSFVTYWLPYMLKHEYIALRFVAQDAYEQAAELCITPVPDVVTRVFMLFRGVAVGDLGLWEAASARAADNEPTFWADVVGVDAARVADSRLFRVLEWGGMEVQ